MTARYRRKGERAGHVGQTRFGGYLGDGQLKLIGDSSEDTPDANDSG
ncbi:hypothetical protein [Arthrobacter sp. UYCu512]